MFLVFLLFVFWESKIFLSKVPVLDAPNIKLGHPGVWAPMKKMRMPSFWFVQNIKNGAPILWLIN